MADKNLHAVLGVNEKAGPEELRRAWLRLAVQYHPDRNPGDAKAEERFKDISQAYAILSDPTARARYERTRPKPARPKADAPKTDSPKEAKAEEPPADSSRAAGSRPQAEPEEPPDWTEILNTFFQSPKGRDTLKELEEELRRAGLKLSSGGLARRLRAWRPTASEKFRAALELLRAWMPNGPAWTRRRAARYDIRYDLALSPEAAAKRTTVEISYLRDEGRRQELKISLPAGLKNGALLRLPDQGRLRPDGGRGELVLTIKAPPALDRETVKGI
jgi:DnaJ-class molecular chaperone